MFHYDRKIGAFIDPVRSLTLFPWPDVRCLKDTGGEPVEVFPANVLLTRKFVLPKDFVTLLVMEKEEVIRKQEWFVFFCDLIPKQILHYICRFRDGHLGLMSLLKEPDSIERLSDNNAINFLIANCNLFGVRDREWTKSALDRKRKSVLADLGFVPTDQVVRILSKVPVSDISVRNMFRLRKYMPQNIKTFSHLEIIPNDVMSILHEKYFPVTGPDLYRSIVEMKLETGIKSLQAATMLNYIMKTFKQLYQKEIPVFNSYMDIQSVYSEIVEIIDNFEDGCSNFYFTSPFKLKGDLLFHVRCSQELFSESFVQKNCVRDLMKKAVGGDHCFYRYNDPRLTILIVKNSSGKYLLADARGRANAKLLSNLWLKISVSVLEANRTGTLDLSWIETEKEIFVKPPKEDIETFKTNEIFNDEIPF